MKNFTRKREVMAFGVFDIIHDGHRHFLTNARKFGEHFTAVAATDESVLKLKGHLPTNALAVRIKNLKLSALADEVIVGDDEPESWNVLKQNAPDIIALGYDQKELGIAIAKFIIKNKMRVQIVQIEPYKDLTLHSSTLRGNVNM